jgi:hypothetical protein
METEPVVLNGATEPNRNKSADASKTSLDRTVRKFEQLIPYAVMHKTVYNTLENGGEGIIAPRCSEELVKFIRRKILVNQFRWLAKLRKVLDVAKRDTLKEEDVRMLAELFRDEEIVFSEGQQLPTIRQNMLRYVRELKQAESKLLVAKAAKLSQQMHKRDALRHKRGKGKDGAEQAEQEQEQEDEEEEELIITKERKVVKRKPASKDAAEAPKASSGKSKKSDAKSEDASAAGKKRKRASPAKDEEGDEEKTKEKKKKQQQKQQQGDEEQAAKKRKKAAAVKRAKQQSEDSEDDE